jgi:putative sterol carrier protein
MPVFNNDEQLYNTLKLLFKQISEQNPQVTESVNKSRLILRLSIRDPEVELLINGRSKPVKISYGPSDMRPDIDVEMTADAFHNIMLGELRLKKALGSGQMKVKGPVWKSFVLEDIFHQGQKLYSDILKEQGLST